MKAFFKHNGIFILIYLGLLIFVGHYLLEHGKVQIQKQLNEFVGNNFIDSFFKYVTFLGDGLFAFFVIAVFLFKNVRVSLYIFLSYFGAAIVSSILKHGVYADIYRPHFVFVYFVRDPFKTIDGVNLMGFNSFPSGHALSAFALFFCLIFISKNYLLKVICFCLALLAAYSRVHLFQHWLIDIYVGSIIGISFSMMFYFMFYKSSKFQNLNTTLPQLLSKNKTTSV